MIESIISNIDEQYELNKFKNYLTERIEVERDVLFSYADCGYERQQNSEVKEREEKGDREFDYKESISKLISNLVKMDMEKRSDVINRLKYNRINYTINGVFVSRDIGRPETLLLADFAEDPLKYL